MIHIQRAFWYHVCKLVDVNGRVRVRLGCGRPGGTQAKKDVSLCVPGRGALRAVDVWLLPRNRARAEFI